jgi:UDP-GlcNAc:undecaprenyl-phosphate GlcNAc-1-phosphate transferase
MAQPRPDRWHQKPTPNTGGLGILIACAFGYLLFAGTGNGAIAACAGGVSILGFVDDRLQLHPRAKLAGQTAAAVVLISTGMSLNLTPSTWANGAITALWIVGITNAFNLIDNMDGLCGGVAAIVAGSGAWLAILHRDYDRALLILVVAGACLGFLTLNYKPARIFMGDCGSLFLGFSLASLALTRPVPFTSSSVLHSLYPLTAFLYPIFDMGFVSVLRRSAGRPVSVGGRDHSSHRLVSTGLTERKTVWVLWACTAVSASLGPLMNRKPGWFIATAALLLVALTVFGFFLARVPGFAPPASSPIRKSWGSAAADRVVMVSDQTRSTTCLGSRTEISSQRLGHS